MAVDEPTFNSIALFPQQISRDRSRYSVASVVVEVGKGSGFAKRRPARLGESPCVHPVGTGVACSTSSSIRLTGILNGFANLVIEKRGVTLAVRSY